MSAPVGRAALSVDLHLWVRELTRIDRVAVRPPRTAGATTAIDRSQATTSRGISEQRPSRRSTAGTAAAPAGASALAAVGGEPGRQTTLRSAATTPPARAVPRPALCAAGGRPCCGTGQDGVPRPGGRGAALVLHPPAAAARLGARTTTTRTPRGLGPARAHPGRPGRRRRLPRRHLPVVPQKDGIRFLGSAIATLLSVSAVDSVRREDLDRPGEEGAGLHRQRAGRRAPGRFRRRAARTR